MRRLATIVSVGLVILMLAACGSPRSQAPSPASLLDEGSFRVTMDNQVFTDAVVVSQGANDDTLITMIFDEGRIELAVPNDIDPGSYSMCRMALYEIDQCVTDPIGVRVTTIQDGEEVEAQDFAGNTLTLESTSPLGGSFRIVPNDGPILEGVFLAP